MWDELYLNYIMSFQGANQTGSDMNQTTNSPITLHGVTEKSPRSYTSSMYILADLLLDYNETDSNTARYNITQNIMNTTRDLPDITSLVDTCMAPSIEDFLVKAETLPNVMLMVLRITTILD